MVKLFSKNSNLCDHNSPTLQTDRQTTCDRNTALCTKVHRAVKMILAVWLGSAAEPSQNLCAPDPIEELAAILRRRSLQCSPDSMDVFKGPTFKERARRGRRKGGSKMEFGPPNLHHRSTPLRLNRDKIVYCVGSQVGFL